MSRFPRQIRLDDDLLRVMTQLAAEDEGNLSLAIRRALRQSPPVAERLKAAKQQQKPTPAGAGHVG